MPTILLVENRHSAETSFRLREHGYEVLAAATGREAIDLGARVRPDLMLIDWMLPDPLDGIRVIETLGVIGYTPRTVMMAAFVTADLQEDGRTLGVAEILPKPIEPERLLASLTAALGMPAPSLPDGGQVAVLEISQRGEIVRVNRRAEQLFAGAGYESRPRFMSELFAPNKSPDLRAAEARWVAVSPSASSHVNWHIRTQAPRVSGTRLAVILEANDPHYRHQEIISAVLGLEPATRPIDGCVLIVDAAERFRRLNKRMLAAAGIHCQTAASFAQALYLLRANPGISVVIIDLDTVTEPAAPFVRQLRELNEALRIVGASTNRPGRPAGIPLMLNKPWTVGALVALIEQDD